MDLLGMTLYVHSIRQSIPIDFVCLELSEHFIAAAQHKDDHHFTRIEVKPLTSTSPFRPLPQPPSALPTCPPARWCCSAATFQQHHLCHHHQSSSSSSFTVTTHICETNDPPSPCSPDKYAPTLSLSLSRVIYLSVASHHCVSTGCLQF